MSAGGVAFSWKEKKAGWLNFTFTFFRAVRGQIRERGKNKGKGRRREKEKKGGGREKGTEREKVVMKQTRAAYLTSPNFSHPPTAAATVPAAKRRENSGIQYRAEA